MNEAQRRRLEVIVTAGQTYYESSCNPKAKARGPNGTAYGLAQLHLGKEQSYVARSDFYEYCPRNAAKGAESSLRCALATKFNSMEEGKTVISNDTYWEVFQTPSNKRKRSGKYGDVFSDVIASIPDCDAKNLALYQDGNSMYATGGSYDYSETGVL